MGTETASTRSGETSLPESFNNRYDPDAGFQVVQCCDCSKLEPKEVALKTGWLVGIAGTMCPDCQQLNLPW